MSLPSTGMGGVFAVRDDNLHWRFYVSLLSMIVLVGRGVGIGKWGMDGRCGGGEIWCHPAL